MNQEAAATEQQARKNLSAASRAACEPASWYTLRQTLARFAANGFFILLLATADAQPPYPTEAGSQRPGGETSGSFAPITTEPQAHSPAPIVTYESPPATGSFYGESGAAPIGAPSVPVAAGPQAAAEPDHSQTWQSYPAPGSVAPAATPAFIGQGPTDPSTTEPGNPKSLLPPGTRDGVFQKVKFTGTWMPQLENDSLGWTDLRTEVVFGLPFFTRETPLVITPSYEAHFLDRPIGIDLPPRLHDAAIDFHHFRRVGDHWIIDASVTPGVYADDYSFDSSDAIRVSGRGLAIYEPSPQWRWIMGVAYLDGAGWDVVPVAGVAYSPNDDTKYELVFPRPQIAWRLPSSPVPGIDERWFYIGAEFGSGIWAIEHVNGSPDVLVSRDYRILMGLERKIIGGLSRRIEIGYVFGRQIELDSTPGEINLDDTFMVRTGLVY
ncbi:MAG: DUF6268 family outer membrane beta-barrel protein [Planctomycetes bacterium]|nr:DUF6268 family outer membrane beta-barrel protein [Planctomycetota bacterium]